MSTSGATIGTAGWSLRGAAADRFPAGGSHLARYAARFSGVEINSSFYRSHRPATYARWAAATPSGFRFSVKLPRTITHRARLADAMPLAAAFRREAEALGEKLGPLLVQLPPSLAFDPTVVEAFFAGLRAFWPETIVCEPRHVSWFRPESEALLCGFRVGRVAADPACAPAAASPGGWTGVRYWRLHGSPRMYWSAYDAARLEALASQVASTDAGETWCVFDNTASAAATIDALTLQAMLGYQSAKAAH